MKIGSVKITAALSALDPATTELVESLYLIQGVYAFETDDVMVSDGMVFARARDDADRWLYIPTESITGFHANLDRKACAEAKVDPTLAAVLEYSLSR